jgi:hypothetical protein
MDFVRPVSVRPRYSLEEFAGRFPALDTIAVAIGRIGIEPPRIRPCRAKSVARGSHVPRRLKTWAMLTVVTMAVAVTATIRPITTAVSVARISTNEAAVGPAANG